MSIVTRVGQAMSRAFSVSLFCIRSFDPQAETRKLYRDQYNPELTVPESVVEEWIAVGTFRAQDKKEGAVKPQAVRDWTFAERAK